MTLDRDTTITWYGHACIEIRTPGGKTILIDPWFGNPKSPKTADAVEACDVMLLTHGHFDHIGYTGDERGAHLDGAGHSLRRRPARRTDAYLSRQPGRLRHRARERVPDLPQRRYR